MTHYNSVNVLVCNYLKFNVTSSYGFKGPRIEKYLGRGRPVDLLSFKGSAVPERLRNRFLQNTLLCS